MDNPMIVDTGKSETPRVIMAKIGKCPIGHRNSRILPYVISEIENKCPITYYHGKCRRCGNGIYNTLIDKRAFTYCNNGWVVCGRCFYNTYCLEGSQPIDIGKDCVQCKKPLRILRARVYKYHVSFNCFDCGVRHVELYEPTYKLLLEGSPELPEAKVGEVKWVVAQ